MFQHQKGASIVTSDVKRYVFLTSCLCSGLHCELRAVRVSEAMSPVLCVCVCVLLAVLRCISYLTAVVPCAEQGTTECDNALIRAVCRSLNLTAPDQPIPQVCSS